MIYKKIMISGLALLMLTGCAAKVDKENPSEESGEVVEAPGEGVADAGEETTIEGEGAQAPNNSGSTGASNQGTGPTAGQTASSGGSSSNSGSFNQPTEIKQAVTTFKDVSRNEPIEFEIKEIPDETLEVGEIERVQKGVMGVRQIITRTTYIDGVEVKTEEYSSKITTHPIEEIIKVGAKPTELVIKEDKEMSKKAFDLINEIRVESGLHALTWSDEYYEFSLTRAKESFEKFSHTRPDGTQWYEGSTLGLGTENLAAGNKSAEGFVTGWYNSEAHKTNLLNKDVRVGAVAIIITNQGYKTYAANITGYR